ncbi:MAG: DUF5018 domain-containing protein [Marinifilaceae bacterium]|jgi:hypothetical protein|nr:DUF5018 domain-containing protein [Marinifilaceae bacterium]
MRIRLILCLVVLVFYSCKKEKIGSILNSEARIKTFKIEDYQVELLSDSIIISVDYNIDISSMRPEIEISFGAEISPKSRQVMDFTKDVKYTITAEDGTVRS